MKTYSGYLADKIKELEALIDYQQNHRDKLEPAIDELERLEPQGVTLYSYDATISLTGDKHKLQRIFHVLRSHGFKPDDRPVKGSTEFTTNFRNGEATIYLVFSSTQCRRVQVGTRTQEVPVYETVCDELVLYEPEAA